MVWRRIKGWLGGGERGGGGPPPQPPEVRWLDPTENPWGVPVLDVRPVTLNMLSTSRNPACAANAVSFVQDDGLGFLGDEPPVSRRTEVDGLRFRAGGALADGALFLPQVMEHKWALYLHGGRILCIRSWLRQVQAIADVRVAGGWVEVTTLRGTLVADDEEPAFGVRVLDYLLRSHALDLVWPAPLPAELAADPRLAALWCMSCFGNRALFATPHELERVPPEPPLRTDSLLHIAAARGDPGAAAAQLARGVPVDLLARDGLAPLHWALARADIEMLRFLIERGSAVDVRSAEGATPLMNAVQGRNRAQVAFLLDHGADPNATDHRGFTAMHRAAEMGQLDLVELLLDHGATPHPIAQGQTPLALAEARGEAAIVDRLRRAESG